MASQVLSSWNGTLPAGVLLDSGVLYIGPSPSTAWAAMDGGMKWDPGKTLREIEFDGKRSAVAGLDRTVMWKPKLTASVIQMPLAAWSQLEPGMVLATVAGGPSGATQVQPKPAGVLYAAGDYLIGARAVWELADKSGYFQLRMAKALVVKWAIAGTDKQEAKWDIEIEARLDMSVTGQLINNPPFVGEYIPSTDTP